MLPPKIPSFSLPVEHQVTKFPVVTLGTCPAQKCSTEAGAVVRHDESLPRSAVPLSASECDAASSSERIEPGGLGEIPKTAC